MLATLGRLLPCTRGPAGPAGRRGRTGRRGLLSVRVAQRSSRLPRASQGPEPSTPVPLPALHQILTQTMASARQRPTVRLRKALTLNTLLRHRPSRHTPTQDPRTRGVAIGRHNAGERRGTRWASRGTSRAMRTPSATGTHRHTTLTYTWEAGRPPWLAEWALWWLSGLRRAQRHRIPLPRCLLAPANSPLPGAFASQSQHHSSCPRAAVQGVTSSPHPLWACHVGQTQRPICIFFSWLF